MTYSKKLYKTFMATALLSASSLSTPIYAETPAATPVAEKPVVHHKKQHHMSALEMKVAEISKELAELKAKEAKVEEKKADSQNPLLDRKALTFDTDKANFKLSGWVNRAAVFYDNGFNRELRHLDPSAQSTRTTFTGTSKEYNNVKGGFVLEAEYNIQPSNATDLSGAGSSTTGNSPNIRIADVFLDTFLGKVTFGHGNTATNHLMNETDLTGTHMIIYGFEGRDMAGGVKFATSKTSGTVTTLNPNNRYTTVTQAYSEILGSSRKSRIAYVTPNIKSGPLQGLNWKISHADRNIIESALTYDRTFSGTQVKAQVGWSHDPHPFVNTYAGVGAIAAAPISGVMSSITKVDRYGGSLGVLFPIGFNFSVAYAQQKVKTFTGFEGRSKGNMFGAKLGWKYDVFSFGKSCFAVGYMKAKRTQVTLHALTTGGITVTNANRYSADNNTNATIWGAYFVQNLDRLNSEVYVAWQSHKLSTPNPTTLANQNAGGQVTNVTALGYTQMLPCKRINSIFVGMRFKF